MSRETYTAEQAYHHLQQGQEKGLAYYFQTYDTALVYFALRITSDEAAAEDLVAEAFVKLWEARENMAHPGAVKAYLYQVVRNAAVDWLRRQKRERAHVQAAVRLQTFTESEMDRLEITAETHRTIYSAIGNLPPKCGVVFRKFYLEQKSLPQIAEELGVSVNTVRNQKVQALAILRKALTVMAWLVSLLRF